MRTDAPNKAHHLLRVIVREIKELISEKFKHVTYFHTDPLRH